MEKRGGLISEKDTWTDCDKRDQELVLCVLLDVKEHWTETFKKFGNLRLYHVVGDIAKTLRALDLAIELLQDTARINAELGG